jgi:hypothetical protein
MFVHFQLTLIDSFSEKIIEKTVFILGFLKMNLKEEKGCNSGMFQRNFIM